MVSFRAIGENIIRTERGERKNKDILESEHTREAEDTQFEIVAKLLSSSSQPKKDFYQHEIAVIHAECVIVRNDNLKAGSNDGNGRLTPHWYSTERTLKRH